MTIDVTDLRTTIVPKSDQLNAEQLLHGSMTVTITDVRVGSGDEQPVEVHYEGENGRPYKPCKTMRKVLIYAWGPDGREWVGKSMTLYCDPHVKFGGEAVGGIRISHMSDIPKRLNVSLTATRGKKALYEIEPLRVERGATLAEVLAAIAEAHNKATLESAKALATKLRNADDIAEAQSAYKARVAAIRAAADTPGESASGDLPFPADALLKRLQSAADLDTLDADASVIGKYPLPVQKDLSAAYKARRAELTKE